MAEIKSAIELAMERTKNLVMDEAEKKAFARRDFEERLRALMRRFLEGIRDGKQFLEEYRSIRAESREKGLLLVDLVLEEFPAMPQKEKAFDLLALVGGELGSGLAGKAESLEKEFEGDLEAGVPAVRERIARRLAAMGISGGGVEPNLDAWEEWQDAEKELGARFKGRLLGWREEARAASGA